jgi:hypothetical protein
MGVCGRSGGGATAANAWNSPRRLGRRIATCRFETRERLRNDNRLGHSKKWRSGHTQSHKSVDGLGCLPDSWIAAVVAAGF